MKKTSLFTILILVSVFFVGGVSSADYVEGQIIVGFNEDVIELEAIELIESHGLDLGINYQFTFWKLVLVPVGEEQNWIVVFEEEGIVNYAELNGIVGHSQCNAYFEGFVFNEETDSCELNSASGCSNPFEFATEKECENANSIKPKTHQLRLESESDFALKFLKFKNWLKNLF